MTKSAEHSERGHDQWSASATSRNWACPGALCLAETVKDVANKLETEPQAWGTACHQLSEKCLRNGTDPHDYIGEEEQTKSHKIPVDDELADTAKVYVDYVRRRIAEGGANTVLHIEQKFSLDKLEAPLPAGGTADATLYFPDRAELEIIDLKGGRGVRVEVNENKQTRSYALGAALNIRGLDIRTLRSTIVQPRASHKDGAIRSETYDILELLDWSTELLAAMHRAVEAKAAYEADSSPQARSAWAERYLTPGAHCDFCPAYSFCPKQATSLVSAGVIIEGGNMLKPILPNELSIERLVDILDHADAIQDYVNACRAMARSLVESGVKVGDYILVEKNGHRAYTEKDEAKVAAALQAAGLAEDKLWKKKIISPAQAEKALGKDGKAVLAKMTTRPVTGTNLVRADKTERPAVPTARSLITALDD